MRQTKQEILNGLDKPIISSKIIANNTLRIKYQDGTEAIRLHDTDVVTFKNGIEILNSGGWKTKTTKERINEFSSIYITQSNGVWYVGSEPFFDGIKFKNGRLIGKRIKVNNKKINKLKKQIKDFCNLITEDNLPLRSGGDCWYCYMTAQDGKTLGDSSGNHEHLKSHIKEKYLHGSLLFNAMREAGYQDEQIAYHYQLKLVDTFRRALRKYLQKRLI